MRAADYSNLADVVRPRGGAERDKAALIYHVRTTTYAELDRESSRVARMLIAAGVSPGDPVAVLAKNSAGFVALLFGVAKAGAIFVPLNWRLSATEIGYILADCDPRLALIEQGLENLVPANSAFKQVGFSDDGGLQTDLAPAEANDSDPDLPTGADDVAMLVYTSGTTGHPKGAMIMHRNFLRHCDMDTSAPFWAGVGRDEVVLQVLPLFHVGGLEMLLRPLFAGGTVVLHRELDIEKILEDIDRYKVTMTGLVPTALHMMLQHPKSHEVDFTSLDRFLYGAAPITTGLLKEGLERLGCDFVQSYGMTEANGVCAMLAPEDHADREAPRLRSAGKPTFGAQIRVIDEEGKDCLVGEVGEILVKASGIMKGYWRNPVATAEAIDAEGWLHSGDAGYIDDDGFVYVSDRVKDMIISGGENIYPTEVESAIYGHPAVSEVAVVGIPDDRWGESVQAVVVPKPGATIDPAAIIAYARERIATYKAPRSVLVVSELPKNAAGKILRREVRTHARAVAEHA